MVVRQLSCQGSYHFLKHDYVADAVSLYQYTHWKWFSFRRPRKDDRLSQSPGVLIQRPTGLELRTPGSQAATLTTEPTLGSKEWLCAAALFGILASIVWCMLVNLLRRKHGLETTTTRLHLASSHRRHWQRAFDHVRGRSFLGHQSSDSAPEKWNVPRDQ